jgi:glutamate/aspartate transport system substrate-binding protein
MKRKTKAPKIALFALLIVSACPALAGGALDKIQAAGAVVIGHRESSVPFSYLDQRQQPVGYSLDICARVVEELKTALKQPNLQVRYKLVTPKDRITSIKDGTIDLECGSTTNTLERQKDAAFSVTTYAATVRVAAKKSSKVRTFLDLRNKTVVSTSNTTSLKQLVDLNERDAHKMTIVEGKDHAESFAMLEDGRAAAFAMDDILLSGLIAQARNPADYAFMAQPLSVEPYGIMLRRDDPELKQLVDRAVLALFRSGQINQIYHKWFMAPIPARSGSQAAPASLNVPMNDILKRVIAKPTDSGNPMSYH